MVLLAYKPLLHNIYYLTSAPDGEVPRQGRRGDIFYKQHFFDRKETLRKETLRAVFPFVICL